jgi:hypothetical protein
VAGRRKAKEVVELKKQLNALKQEQGNLSADTNAGEAASNGSGQQQQQQQQHPQPEREASAAAASGAAQAQLLKMEQQLEQMERQVLVLHKKQWLRVLQDLCPSLNMCVCAYVCLDHKYTMCSQKITVSAPTGFMIGNSYTLM